MHAASQVHSNDGYEKEILVSASLSLLHNRRVQVVGICASSKRIKRNSCRAVNFSVIFGALKKPNAVKWTQWKSNNKLEKFHRQ